MGKKKTSLKGSKLGRSLATLFFLLQAIAAAGVVIELILFPLLPAKHMAIVIAVLVFATIVSFALLGIRRGRKLLIVGIIWAILWIAVSLLAVVYLEPARRALGEVTGQTATETIHVEGIAVIVRKDDPAKKLKDTDGYVYAIQTAEEYASSYVAYNYIASSQSINLSLKQYEFYDGAANGLLNGEVGALLADASYVDMLAEYVEGFAGNYRVLEELSFDTELKGIVIPFTPTPMPTLTPEPSISDGPEPSITPGADITPVPTGSGVVSGQATPTPSLAMPPRENSYDVTSNYFSVYFSGIDCYGSISARSRSDVNICMIVNPNTHKILLVTIPRDAYVTIPGVSGGSYDKLTHAGIYGVKVSMNTLENIYGIKLDHYVRVNFTSVERFVDILGGVDVNVPIAFSVNGYTYTQGMNHMDGKKALTFARERHSFAGGDHQRGKDQMELIKAVIAKMQSPAVLNNFSNIMNMLTNNMQTSLTMDQLTSLVRMQLDESPKWTISTYAVQTSGAMEYCYSYKGAKLYVGYINKASLNEASRLMREVMEGR